LVSNRAELSPAAVRAIDSAPQVFVSAASAFEIGTKHRQGKLALAMPPQAWWTAVVERLQLVELSITAAVALASAALPITIVIEDRTMDHKDPGDRLIAATATTHGLTVVTPDPKIAAFPRVLVLW
jgi:PIN domain nuclease of toxin-antitoxin system